MGTAGCGGGVTLSGAVTLTGAVLAAPDARHRSTCRDSALIRRSAAAIVAAMVSAESGMASAASFTA
jgi:hypothetical protein